MDKEKALLFKGLEPALFGELLFKEGELTMSHKKRAKMRRTERRSGQDVFSSVKELNAFLFPGNKKARKLRTIGHDMGTEAARQRMIELEREF